MAKVKVWDLPIRLFHWILVACFAFLFLSGETGYLFDWHPVIGVVVLALLLFRIIWGFVGSTTARFSNFLYSPARIIAYAKTLLSRSAEPHAGHNPLGSLMVFAMLAGLLFQGFTGLFTTDDVLVEGPLYSYVDESTAEWFGSLHHQSFEILMPFVVLHIAAIIFYRVYKKANLVTPMINGYSELPEAEAGQLKMVSGWVGVVLMAACYAVLYFTFRWLSGY